MMVGIYFLDNLLWNKHYKYVVKKGYPSTHPIYKPIKNPYEIEGYYDEVEKTAAAAILRMVEEEKNIAEMYDALTVKTFVFIFGSYLLKIKFIKIF